ncbi:MAG: M1 family aminopeptidase [Vicinamibacterales bacterium]
MRAFLDVLRFELRMQCGSRLFQGVLLLFFAIHVLTLTQTGIHLTDNELIHIDSPYLLFQTQLVLSLFGLLPALIFVVQSIVRDYDRATVELFFTTPVGARSWLLGRFAGGTICALLAAFAGLLGTAAGRFMPWVEQSRIGPFDIVPYAASFVAIDLPNLLVFCAIAFAVAASTRSQAWTFAVAFFVVLVEAALFNATQNGGASWLQFIDPLGGLPIREASRYWTVVELNTRMPVSITVLVNRLIWLGVGASALAWTVARFRLVLPKRTSRVWPTWRRKAAAGAPAPQTHAASGTPGFARADMFAMFASQWRTDLRAVVLSPLFALVSAFTASATLSEYQGNTDLLMGLPLHPLTGLMLGFFRFGLLQFVLLVLIFYSATLVFREREHGLAEIVGATPHPDWHMALSKTLTLIVSVSVLLCVSIATSIALQLLAGHRDVELGLYLQGSFVYNGIYFFMICVLAVTVQALSPGKWSGMVILALLLATLLSLEPLGFEHVLYGFRIPFVIYSDINGFGHFRLPTMSLIVYWSLFCLLLMVAGSLLFPRGTRVEVRERLRDARVRFTPRTARACGVVAALFAASGVWIYWNTNVLNAYETSESRLGLQAAYERAYGSWKNRPTPAFTDIMLNVDLYPDERRLESSGTATLVNRKDQAIREVAISTDRRLRISALSLERGTQTSEDVALGFRVFRLEPPLQPGERVRLEWKASRVNRGFPNSEPDNEIVANGTFVDMRSVVPVPSYDEERELTDAGQRRRLGLPPAPRLPALGDPAWLNTLGFGIDGRTDVHVVFSTSADQTAVAPGVLTRTWEKDGRRFFEYVMEQPIWPAVSLLSARYEVARDSWNGVSLEVYHDPKHPWNVGVMLDTMRKGLDYYSREYSKYPLHEFRILEYPRYRSAAQAFAGGVGYSEAAGFLTDLSGWASLDYTTLHELAHQWWGGMIYGAKMQGRQMLNETMAQYSTLMVFKEEKDPEWLRRILASTHSNYLRGRSREGVAEQPLMYTEDQGNISYNKGALVMFALQDLIGTERMHQGLRNFLDKFAMQPPPYPTSRDLINELRAVAGPEHQQLITDLFERITLFDVAVAGASVKPVGDEYEVTVEVMARQFEADGQGAEREVPLDASFNVVVFPDQKTDVLSQTPLYEQKHRLESGAQTLVIRVAQRPGRVGVDPFHLMIDRTPDDNLYTLPAN